MRTLDAKIGAVQQLDQRGRRTPLPPASLPVYLKPLVVLIDRRTGSAAEFVAYSLQALGRAHCRHAQWRCRAFGDPVLLPDGYQISIPDRQPINLRTGGNWEGTGVRPDVPAATIRCSSRGNCWRLRSRQDERTIAWLSIADARMHA